MDGSFYNVPDEELDQFLVPADEVKSKLGSHLEKSPAPEADEVEARRPRWRNCWRNCWRRNCWRNCY